MVDNSVQEGMTDDHLDMFPYPTGVPERGVEDEDGRRG
jgi:hypothetical protein